MCALLANKRYELLYNCGIQLLHVGRPLAAFECLMEAVQVYHSNPRLWLRLAECCIAANKGVRGLTLHSVSASGPAEFSSHLVFSCITKWQQKRTYNGFKFHTDHGGSSCRLTVSVLMFAGLRAGEQGFTL